ncbi:MAG: SDR family NAD(P)-dependent oxidoreductase [Candidatus Hydrogenedentes bacterium]|nr:SDR family NAD(P)-dependent oxidoreductase [Candidatus Hydrogenedentota bacterium]
MELEGKTFIITGGGSGLGEGTARLFAGAGANVVVGDISKDNGTKVAEEIGARARFVECNVTDEGHVRQAIQTAQEVFGGLHGAVNCAGIAAAMRVSNKFGAHPLDLFKVVLDVNLTGTFNVIRLCAEAMIPLPPLPNGERGVFVNTASVAAFEGQIGQAAYSASKGGVVSMTLPIARELARFGIRVVTIAPGLFDTPMLAALPEEVRASLGQQVPFPPRLGTAREYAQLARQIVENEMLNGTTIRLDGAIRMQPK